MLKKLKVVMLIIFLCVSMFCVKANANSVEYRGEAEGLIATPDDFFTNISELLPGDTEEDVAYIKNTTDDTIEIFFKTEPLDRSEYFDDIDYSLLEKINLKITLKKSGSSEEQEIYDGNLGAESLSEYISLGNYVKGFDGEFRFKLEVPTSLRNAYTLSNTKVKWIFMVVKDDEPIPDEPDEPDTPEEPEKKDESEEKTVPDSKGKIKTGDNIIVAVIALGIVLVIAGVVIILKKKTSKDEKNDK